MPKFIAKNDWEFSMNILLSWKVVWFSRGCKWGTNMVKKNKNYCIFIILKCDVNTLLFRFT